MKLQCKYLFLLALLLQGGVTFAQIPDLKVELGGSDLLGSTNTGALGTIPASIKLMLLFTALSFAPALVLTMTCFTRLAIVLGMTRMSIGTQTAPPNMVITGLALFLTFAIMGPVFSTSYKDGIEPYLDGKMSDKEALIKSLHPFRAFLLANAREKDLKLFIEITKTPPPKVPDDIPIHALIPAFVLSELNTAFQIGFLIALPFLVLDMVVSSVLTSMSMITLPPVVISLPLKLMLFVLVDGWNLIISSLVQTYKVAG
jgi:flagellar biosynthetic protein FliP